MRTILKKSQIRRFFTICKPDGKTINVTNVAQIALALQTSYCYVWHKMQPVIKGDQNFAQIKKCNVSMLRLQIDSFEKAGEDEQKSV